MEFFVNDRIIHTVEGVVWNPGYCVACTLASDARLKLMPIDTSRKSAKAGKSKHKSVLVDDDDDDDDDDDGDDDDDEDEDEDTEEDEDEDDDDDEDAVRSCVYVDFSFVLSRLENSVQGMRVKAPQGKHIVRLVHFELGVVVVLTDGSQKFPQTQKSSSC
jgi:hypothetical protein